jgi:hypothetical protein
MMHPERRWQASLLMIGAVVLGVRIGLRQESRAVSLASRGAARARPRLSAILSQFSGLEAVKACD